MQLQRGKIEWCENNIRYGDKGINGKEEYSRYELTQDSYRISIEEHFKCGPEKLKS
jgi:hypothetical protein